MDLEKNSSAIFSFHSNSIDAMSLNCCYRKAVLEHWDYVVGNEKEKYKKEGDKCKIK